MQKIKVCSFIVLIFLQSYITYSQQVNKLFEPAQIQTYQQGEKINKIMDKVAVKLSTIVKTTNIDLETSNSVSIELFDSIIEFHLVRKEINNSQISWIGKSNENHKIYLVKQGENISGSILKGNEIFSIEPISAGLHLILKIDNTKFKQEAEPLLPPNGFEGMEIRKGGSESNILVDDPIYIDVLVALYTIRSKCKWQYYQLNTKCNKSG